MAERADLHMTLLRSILILPGNVLVAIPAILLWLTRHGAYSWQTPRIHAPGFWLALVMMSAALYLMARTMTLFVTIGKGTPAPWSPPKKFVAVGVYRHVRNPMISGVILFLIGEVLLFQSLALLAWTVVFALANTIYIPLVEEPGLERRFGDSYRRYKAHVPRWMPRLSAWQSPSSD